MAGDPQIARGVLGEGCHWPSHSKTAGKLFDACDRGDVVIVVLSAILVECVFVLESFYAHPRGEVSSALGRLISSPGVEIRVATIRLDALERYRKTKVQFVDCLLASTAAAGDTPVATFDQDFLGGVEFAADVRGETSRRERSCRLADHPERGQTNQYKRVSRYSPSRQQLKSGSPLTRELHSRFC
jgi:predicted nucleic-acid-binding protein